MTPQELQAAFQDMLGKRLRVEVKVYGDKFVDIIFIDSKEPRIRSTNTIALATLKKGLSKKGIRDFACRIATNWANYQVERKKKDKIILTDDLI